MELTFQNCSLYSLHIDKSNFLKVSNFCSILRLDFSSDDKRYNICSCEVLKSNIYYYFNLIFLFIIHIILFIYYYLKFDK